MKLRILGVVASLFLGAGLYGADNRPAPARVLQVIQYPGATSTTAYGINDQRDIVGAYENSSQGPVHAFLFHNGSYFNIDKPGAVWTVADGINNSGEIVGYFLDVDPHTCTFDCGGHGFVRWDETHYQTIEPPGVKGSILIGIDNHHQLLGSDSLFRTFVWDDQKFTFITHIPTGLAINGFNDHRQYVGDGISNAIIGGYDAAIFQGSNLTRISLSGDLFTRAFGINDAGDVTGFAVKADGSGDTGYVYSKGKLELFKVSTFVTECLGINNRGDVVGNAGSTGFALLKGDGKDDD